MLNFITLCLILHCLICAASGKPSWSKVSEDKVAEAFLKSLANSKYDPRLPPEGKNGPGTPLEVSSSMYILDISKVDDYSMDFNAQFYFRQSWNDSRLQFKDSDVTTVSLRDVDSIWTPDLFFVEEKEGSLHEIIHPNMFCKINSAGEVLYSVKLSVVFTCPMDLQKYPHDVQKCAISIESYGFQRKQIELKWSETESEAVSASPNITLLEFDLVDVTKSIKYSSFTFGDYSCLEVFLTFKRKSGFFISKLYIPFIILVLLSWLSLWISSDERCLRLALLLVILYLMVTISSDVNLSIVQTSYIKASDLWIGFCEAMVVATFLEFIIVNLISKKELSDDTSNGKAEIPALETSEKDLASDSMREKSPLSKLINMIDARNPGKGRGNALPYRIDRLSRIMFPVIFIIFNIVYWSIFCTA